LTTKQRILRELPVEVQLQNFLAQLGAERLFPYPDQGVSFSGKYIDGQKNLKEQKTFWWRGNQDDEELITSKPCYVTTYFKTAGGIAGTGTNGDDVRLRNGSVSGDLKFTDRIYDGLNSPVCLNFFPPLYFPNGLYFENTFAGTAGTVEYHISGFTET